ncbi:hypothetical protein A3C23_02650 [Candidatus Roizmanbacteria bacterium RIFCSPHIGHO2_02_FULL_37_13b]|uniref:Addiction module toxin, HicA family n=1 Tax=Candidatus Roizmanbacteria bacterium RIFCSPLOWO2_02_FULL_36_11 TaxID=1802071 RepID=A0A1F7JG28_9BACT|nr:MAG: hypothetical protein A3C23_02650 [Candidatus Roizmanbacteria bacterium RIFCSPHIGHO2_02_FULL_37_13b]OGK54573.1 MAG: hypothetical protein A3H78_01660 [Candidatus Roizmanbacteria bacterium RIFCSPLOWO2_02_FULL_36_11]
MRITFGTVQLCKALTNLGFTPEKQCGTSHQKYNVPSSKIVPDGLRPFIEVVHGRKQYFPPTVSGYLTQLKRLGFTNDEITKAFAKK